MSVNFRYFKTPLKLTDTTTSKYDNDNITGSLILNGSIFIDNTSDATSINEGGSFTTFGGVSIQKSLMVGSNYPSNNSTYGSLLTAGGISIASTYDSTSPTSGGGLTVAGGASIRKNLYVGNHLIVNSRDITPSLGDITKESRATGNNNQTTFSDITGLVFNNSIVRSFCAYLSVEITFYKEEDQEYNPLYGNSPLYSVYEIKGIQKDSSWAINYSHIGDSTDIVFLITNAGQVQYKTPDYGVNFKELDFRFRASTTSINDLSISSTIDFPYDGTVDFLKLNLNGPGMVPLPGMISWNTHEDCLDITHSDGTVLQTGLEQHMKVFNNTGSTLTNGTVIRFSGVNNYNSNFDPYVEPMIADGTIQPLYIVGVVTEDINNSSDGRATWFGKVRNLNTTGVEVNETWNAGDILYVSPRNHGKLTKVKPTAPDIVISVAAVLKSHSTDGIILVRPTIYPRLHYGSFLDNTIQSALLPNTPYPIKYNTTSISNGHYILNNSKVVASNSGLYNYQFSLQLSSSNSSKKDVYIWARKNGDDIPNSSTRITIVGNDEYKVAAWNFVISMNANDYFELMWATTDITAKIDAPSATGFSPAIPSVILSVTEAAL